MTEPGGGVLPSAPELAALATRAARGAGLPWAIAEEAGRAATWLACRGQDGAGALLARLDGPPGTRFAPAARRWQAAGPICALHAGIALADFAGLPEGPGPDGVTLGPVLQPVLLLPFVSRAAATRGTRLSLAVDGVTRARIDATGVVLAHAGLPDGIVTLDPSSDIGPTPPPTRPAALSRATWDRLETLALRSTVPSSARSREDAGAAASDND